MTTILRIRYALAFAAIVGVMLTYAGCKESATNPPENNNNGGTIKTGDNVDVASQSVGSSGGTVTVSATGKPVDGLQIVVPANAYSAARAFAVSYAPVTSHSFGEFFKPVSPLITISNGGGYADSLMFVKIPVSLAVGELPFAFFYNDAKGTLEPIPMVSHDASSVTIMTRHFDVSGIAARASGSKFSPAAIPNFSKIIVSGMTDIMYNNIVGKLSSVSSGYVPGIDDWEFENHGSFLAEARGGHCAGQDLSSLWYFFERKSKEGKLHHRFDQIDVSPKQIWEDDPIGYHMASATQARLNWSTYELSIYQGYLGSQDDWVWKDLILTMVLSHEPMSLGIYGLHQGKSVGHNLTAYAVDIANKKIHVADPNFPGDLTREIVYSNGTFTPYYSGPTAAQSDFAFNWIYLNGKTAVIDWTTIGQTWTDVVDNKQNPGYPAYSFWVNDGAGYPLTDGLSTDLDTLDFIPKWTMAGRVAMTVYDESGNRLAPPSGADFTLVFRDTQILNPGQNKFGIAVYGEADGGFHYIDFQWITVNYQSSTLRIEPATSNCKKDSTYSWKAVLDNKPSRARYEWDFGDGSAKYIVTNDTSGWHSYHAAGMFTIKLQVFDQNTSTKVAEATATATVGAGFEITSVVPDKVSYAMPITINGSGFGATQGTSTLMLGGVAPESIVSWSDTKIVATIPDVTTGSMTAQVVVGGVTSNTKYLTRMYPKIVSLSKTHSMPDELVEIRGQYFGYKQAGATVYHRYEQVPWTIVSWSDTLIRALASDATYDWHYGYGYLYIVRQGWGMSSIEFTLDEDVLRTLHRTNSWTTLTFGGLQLMYSSFPDPHEEYQGFSMNLYNKDFSHTKKLIWTGTSFTFTFTQSGGGATYNITLDGTMSDDGQTILSIHGLYEYTFQNQSTSTDHHYEFRFKDVPLRQSYPGDPSVEYGITGAAVQDHVVSVVYREETNQVVQTEYRGTDWTSTQSIPEIKFRFQTQ